MLILKAEDYGFELGVTGFEESNNLAYLDGERNAKLEVVRKGLIGGVDEGIISSLTGFSIDQLRETKRRL